MMTPWDSAWAAISGGTDDSTAVRASRSSMSNATAAWLLPAMATRSVPSVAPGKAAARPALPASQRSTSRTAWVMTILGIWSSCTGIRHIGWGSCVTGPAVDLGRYRGAGSGQGSWLMTVALNGAASSSSSGAYAPVAAASFIELIPPTGLGLQFDNHLDGHLAP